MIQDRQKATIMPQPIISAQQLTQKIQLSQKQLTIFEDLNLEILAGEQVAITGRSALGNPPYWAYWQPWIRPVQVSYRSVANPLLK